MINLIKQKDEMTSIRFLKIKRGEWGRWDLNPDEQVSPRSRDSSSVKSVKESQISLEPAMLPDYITAPVDNNIFFMFDKRNKERV